MSMVNLFSTVCSIPTLTPACMTKTDNDQKRNQLPKRDLLLPSVYQ